MEHETSDMPGKRATFTPWTEHHAKLYMRLTMLNNMVNISKMQQRLIENRVVTRKSNSRPLTCRESVIPLHHQDIYVFSCIILLYVHTGEQYCMIYDVMLAGLVRIRLGMSKARGRGRSTTLNCTCAYKDE